MEKIIFAHVELFLWTLLCFSMSVHSHFIQFDDDVFRVRDTIVAPLPTQDMHGKELTAAESMVDLSNDVTYRILHYHSILNRNNFAFSPPALMSALVALYEGSSGRSAFQLRNVLQFPNSRDVIRVGYRDIHRRLRTYFFGSDKTLKGLSLNQNNVTITRDYETVLMFYGYDLSKDMVPSSSLLNTTPVLIVDTATTNTISTTNTNLKTETTLPTDATQSVPTQTKITITTTPYPITFKVPNETELAVLNTTTIEPVAVTIINKDFETNNNVELISSYDPDSIEQLLRIQNVSVLLTRPRDKLLLAKPKISYLPFAGKAHGSLTMRPNRGKRHLYGNTVLDAGQFEALFPTSSSTNYFPFMATAMKNKFESEPNFLSNSGKKSNYNTDIINHVFYLNGQHIIHATFKVYNAVLYFKYYENLKMSVLELELDTPEYNLIIILPDFNNNLVATAASLRHAPTLRLMRKNLRPRWVQAVIPDFKLFGTIFLTNDLQNMGINDIFEPSLADLRAMTDEKGIYVKHIEQMINVNIRTRPINQLKRTSGQQTQPIQISVNHPFLFFIIDRDLDVAVMAGRVLNPLNSRIQ